MIPSTISSGSPSSSSHIVDEPDGPLWVHVETCAERPVCGGCSAVSAVKSNVASRTHGRVGRGG